MAANYETRQVVVETVAGIDRILEMLDAYKGTATFESPQEKREFALGAGFVHGAALNAKATLETFLDGMEVKDAQ